MSQYKGTAKWFNNVKGSGLPGVDGREDVSVHHRAIQSSGYKNLEAGDAVEFDVVEGSTERQQVDQGKRSGRQR